MKFKNMYFNNNEINKKKYKKHSQSPFVKLDAGNVEKNIEIFNQASTPVSNSGMMEDLKEEGKMKQKKTYRYIGPIYHFDKFIDEVDMTTQAVSRDQAANNIVGRYKKEAKLPMNYVLQILKENIVCKEKIEAASFPEFTKEERYNDFEQVAREGKYTIYYRPSKNVYIIDGLPMEFTTDQEAIEYASERD